MAHPIAYALSRIAGDLADAFDPDPEDDCPAEAVRESLGNVWDQLLVLAEAVGDEQAVADVKHGLARWEAKTYGGPEGQDQEDEGDRMSGGDKR